MRNLLIVIGLVLISAPAPTVMAQGPKPRPQATPKPLQCEGKIFKRSEVDRKTKTLTFPQPNIDLKEVMEHKGVRIVIKAVFCADGRVTDLKVTSGASVTLDQAALEAARNIKFVPAWKDGEKVSQWMTLEYNLGLEP